MQCVLHISGTLLHGCCFVVLFGECVRLCLCMQRRKHHTLPVIMILCTACDPHLMYQSVSQSGEQLATWQLS